MFANILVPIDGSAESNAALPFARTVAHETGASITLLRVLRPAEVASNREAATVAANTLKHTAAESGSAGVTFETVVREGDDVADEILEQSRAQGAELIIMRTHGRVGLERAILGSVTQRVLADSGVPVMLVRPDEREIGQIQKLLVPIDGSPGGAVALGTAVALAQETGASITVLEVAVPMPTWAYAGDPFGAVAYYDPAWDEESLAAAKAYVGGIVARMQRAGLAVEGQARQERDVADTIVNVAEQVKADLIVMSTQALTGPARALLGSVADAVVRTAHSPVLLVHRSEAARTEQAALSSRA
jgi:nucleotide-binding universal stress UspA family protein